MENNKKRVYNNILDMIGSTPLLKLNKYPKSKGVTCQIYCKLELYNPGTSIKDRIAYQMIKDAEKDELIKKGDTIVEATSGNTGIGVALISKMLGYNSIITISEKMSREKILRIKYMGADVIVTPMGTKHHEKGNFYQIAKDLDKKDGYFHLNQFKNQNNPKAHYLNTAVELLEQLDKKIDIIFLTVGTGGTLNGISRKIKEELPDCKIIVVDPYGSTLAKPDELNKGGCHSFEIEGIGSECKYDVMDCHLVDGYVKVKDKESFLACREIMKTDGIFIGGSSGACLFGAITYLKNNNLENQKDLNCALIFADSGFNYISKFVDDLWMVGKGFLPTQTLYDPLHPLKDKFLKDFDFFEPIPFFNIKELITIQESFDILNKNKIENIVFVKEDYEREIICGVVDKKSLVKFMIERKLNLKDDVRKCKFFEVLELDWEVSFACVQKMLENLEYILLVKRDEGVIKTIYSVNNNDMFNIYSKLLISD